MPQRKESDHARDPGVEALDRAGQQERNENEDVLGPLMKPEPLNQRPKHPLLGGEILLDPVYGKTPRAPGLGRQW